MPYFVPMKKVAIVVILVSMLLHCASRIGILSYAYQKRHEIAFSLGITQERSIATCSSDYDFGRGLTIQTSDDESAGIPVAVFQTKEINLFIQEIAFNITRAVGVPIEYNRNFAEPGHYPPPLKAIFHPPAVV